MVRLPKSIRFYPPRLDDSISQIKIHEKLITAIETLIKQWAAIVELHQDQSLITSDVINFSNGIFEGDSISVLLFILSLNSISYTLAKLKGYNYGNELRLNFSKKQLDLVTQFSKDVCIDFGIDKCAYLKVEKGTIVSDGEP